MKIKLARALLRRKELQQMVDRLKAIQDKDLFVVKVQRQNVTESVDNIMAQVPLLTASQVNAEFAWHARQLREVDAVIQQTNWTAEVEVNDEVMADFVPKTPVRD